MSDRKDLSSLTPTILIVDDEPDFVRGLARSIPREIPARILSAFDAFEALRLIDAQSVDLVVSDIRMPDMDGIELLQEIKSRDPLITVVVMTAYGTIGEAVDAMKKGAYDFVQKPFKQDEINRILKKALERNHLIRENVRLKDRLSGAAPFDLFVYHGPGMQKVLRTMRTVASLNVTVLLRGESGTGKDVAARYIHMLSPRSEHPMVTVNCPTIPESLLESELFGYFKGAFTGASADRKGLIQQADGSTLFLDEIGDIPLAIQAKLLRLIQEKEIRSLGASQSRTVDVRIIASTNSDLEEKISGNSFREDLFYRLNVVTISMPPLRSIREDIPILTQHFVQQAATEFNITPKSVSPDAMRHLTSLPWPGNIRQLRNAVQKAMIFSKGETLEMRDFLEDQDAADYRGDEAAQITVLPFRTVRDKMVADFTKRYLEEALTRNRGNVSAAARDSGIERQHFQKLMRKFGLRSASFRGEVTSELQCNPKMQPPSLTN
jgi:DNA-binding NtrC family response regulator